MDTIAQIMALSGDVPDPDKFRHYLQGMSPDALQERLAALVADEKKLAKKAELQYGKPRGGKVVQQLEFWTRATQLAIRLDDPYKEPAT